eukprot:262934_1
MTGISNDSKKSCQIQKPSLISKCNESNIKHQQNKLSNTDNAITNFTSKVISLWQTDPIRTNYTVYIEIKIGYNNRFQSVKFPYSPDQESLGSVINEMVNALRLNKHLHHKIIVESIENAMKTKQMKIVKTSPIEPHKQENDEYLFPPLSPLVISPRLTRNDSNSTFPDLLTQSHSMSQLLEGDYCCYLSPR